MKRGFTLLELLFVLLILGILVGVAMPRYIQSTKVAKQIAFESNLKDIIKALEEYKIQQQFQNFAYPSSLDVLKEKFIKEPINPYTNKSMLGGNPTDSGILYQPIGTSYKLCIVQRDVDDVNNNGVVEEVLPLSTKTTCIGNTQTSVGVTFARNSVAYTSDGTQVAVNVPRFEQGKFGQAVLVEEGTTNLISNGNCESNAPNLNSTILTGRTTYLLSSDWAHDGGSSLKVITGSAASEDKFVQLGAYESLNGLTDGQTYTFSAYVYVPQGTDPSRVALRFYDYANGRMQIVLSRQQFRNLSWRLWEMQVTRTIRSGATAAFVRLEVRHAEEGKVAYFDAIQLEQKPYATSFIDGTRAAESLTIPTASVLNPQEGTVECW